MIPHIHISDYNYPLDDARIAKYPLAQRDSSKLLVYRDGSIEENVFSSLPDYIQTGSLMVFNDTKVVPARLHFRRESGARIEIFCQQPASPPEYATAFATTASCTWKCVIGNAKRWKDDILGFDTPDGESHDELRAMNLRAKLISRDGQTGLVEFSWDGGAPFSRVLELCGEVPIPPYLNRATEDIDKERYQTLYAHVRGSVAAPTAGLHFTEAILNTLKNKGVDTETVCLHVGAGTFLPVKSDDVTEHDMHREPFSVSIDLIQRLIDSLESRRPVVAVGTTSVRTLESLYYVGVSCIENGEPEDVSQWAPYEREYAYSTQEALEALVSWLKKNSKEHVEVGTRIIIVPGFKFRLVNRLVTNFHQPESTLILLVSAFVDGNWKSIYDYALSHEFRFLSYGDSSLLYRKTE